LRRGGLPDGGRHLLRVLLRHVEIQPGPGGGAEPPPRPL
ncbi:MAG: Glutamate Aspartate transport system permease protein GltK, partial [uncultured Acetobacteraceae bacterium]